ncbi:hypothetical protein [Microbacterium maritypicum]
MTDEDDSWMHGLNSAAYDDDLDAILTSRGWISDRSWKDEMVFDRWRIRFSPNGNGISRETTIACHDKHNDQYHVELAGRVGSGITLGKDMLLGMLEKLESHTP